MNCPNCGTSNLDNARICVNCGRPLDGGGVGTTTAPPAPPPPEQASYTPPPPQASYTPPQSSYTAQPAGGQPPPNYLWQSIVVTVCCCPPFGIVAIIFAAQVNQKWAAGDIAGAMQASKNAKMWTLIGFAIGLLIIIIYLLAGGAAFLQAWRESNM